MPSFPYNNMIPAATDELSQSQSDIQGNFASIQSFVDFDHVDFANAQAGMHKAVHFVTQASAPTTNGAMNAMYTAAGILGSAASFGGYSMFLQPQNQSTFASAIEFTASVQGATPSNGWTMLPSGVMMQWGSITANGTFQAFPTPFPNNCFSITCTARNAIVTTLSVNYASITKTGCIIIASFASPVLFFAIGN